MERLQQVADEATTIRKSMQIIDPRQNATEANNPNFGLDIGDRRIIDRKSPRYLEAVANCAGLMAGLYSGRVPSYHLQESMATSDFPLLFGDVMNRIMLGNYTPFPVSYPEWMRIYDLKDFRTLNMYTLDGGQGILEKVNERAPYKEVTFSEARYQLAVAKYGRKYSISFEMLVNDDLNAFQERPMLMAQGARWSEEFLATQQLCYASGPHNSFFTSGNANIVTANPALSIAGLQTAYQVIKAQLNSDSMPIVVDMYTLVVPPALEVTARNILNGTELWLIESGGTTNQKLKTENWMRSKVKLVVNAMIPLVATTANGDRSWFLIANPKDVTARPAFSFGFLRGYRQPQIYYRQPDQISISGGGGGLENGSFDHDAIDYKLRHFYGAGQVDPKMAVASNGSGS